jgi:hypothetical protein
MDHGRPGERPRDDREQVEADRGDDPLPLDVAKGGADRGEAAVPPPDQRAEPAENGSGVADADDAA